MTTPSIQKLKTVLRTLRLHAGYHTAACLATMVGAPFWFFEQRRGRLADLLENERTPQ